AVAGLGHIADSRCRAAGVSRGKRVGRTGRGAAGAVFGHVTDTGRCAADGVRAREAVVGGFVAGASADSAAGARVARVHAAGAAGTRVGTVAERSIVAGSGVVRVCAGSAAVAEVVGARIAVARTWRRSACERVGRTRGCAAAEFGD